MKIVICAPSIGEHLTEIEYDLTKLEPKIVTDDGKEILLQELIEFVLARVQAIQPVRGVRMELEDKIQEYLKSSFEAKAKMQSKLFQIFTETTGYRPQDLCIVEQQIKQGLEFKTIYYFDLKHRHQTVPHPGDASK